MRFTLDFLSHKRTCPLLLDPHLQYVPSFGLTCVVLKSLLGLCSEELTQVLSCHGQSVLSFGLASPRPNPFRRRALVVHPPPPNRLFGLKTDRPPYAPPPTLLSGCIMGTPPKIHLHRTFFPPRCRTNPHRGSRDHWPPGSRVGLYGYV